MGLGQYLKETRSELNHVAWPTRTQTIVFTVLVIALSLFVSLYIGLFDYIFTSALGRGLDLLPTKESAIQLQEIATSSLKMEPVVAPTSEAKQ